MELNRDITPGILCSVDGDTSFVDETGVRGRYFGGYVDCGRVTCFMI